MIFSAARFSFARLFGLGRYGSRQSGQTLRSSIWQPTLDKKGEPIVCQTCQGSGYRGRTAAFELLELNDEIRQLIIDGATVAQIRSACRKNKMLYLQEQALRKVIDGETSVQEVIRISQQAKRK